MHAYEQPRFREAKDIGDPFVKPPPREVFLLPTLLPLLFQLIKIIPAYKASHLHHFSAPVVLRQYHSL